MCPILPRATLHPAAGIPSSSDGVVFVLGSQGSPSPVIFVTFQSPSPPNPSNSIFFSFVGRKSRQDNNTTTRNSNSQSHFSYGTGFLFPSVQLFPTFPSHPFIRFFPISLPTQSHGARKFPLLFPLNFRKVVPEDANWIDGCNAGDGQ